jgi:hypothetical protein
LTLLLSPLAKPAAFRAHSKRENVTKNSLIKFSPSTVMLVLSLLINVYDVIRFGVF